jgi:glycine/D-amino acid oxidase-like deaminating enzyme
MIPSANIVIIGGGGAGIAAASTALECAITGIIVLEKRVNTGGNSALAGGFLFGVESPPQERAIFQETPTSVRSPQIRL